MSKSEKYVIYIRRSAEREMDQLPKATFGRVASAILALENDPRPTRSKKLHGPDEYRLRIGDYRILYTVDDKKKRIDIVAVGHRREVYRGL